jgi:YD repeat-containing protein
VVQGIDAENYLTTYTYDAFGNLTLTLRLEAKVQGTVTAGQAVTVTSTAPGSGAYVLADAALDQLTQRDYDRNNRLLRETDAEGYVEGTPGALNAFGERTSVRNKLGATTTYTYDRLGRVLTETLPVSVKVAGVDKPVVNAYEYDSRGNRIKHIEAQGLAEQRTTEMRYDAANRLTTRIGMAYAALSASDTLSTVTPADSYRYDARGNLVEHLSHGQLQADGSVTGGKRTVSYHDALDRQVLQLSADRVATRTSYDQAGHVVAQTTYATRLADAAAIDPATAPTITQDAANDRTYTHRYDELGRKVETLLDGLHAWDSGLTGTGLIISGLTPERTSLQKFFYDAAGNLTEVRNGRGYSSYGYYDGIGRKTLSLDAAGAAIAWDYERASGVATRETQYSGMLPGGYGRQADTLAGNGSINTPAQLLPVIQGLSSRVALDDRITEFTLDRLDRVTEKRVLNVAQNHVDSTGTRTQALATATTRYSYNGLGQVTQLSELAAKLGSTDTWEVSDISYDALGRETRRQGVEFTDWEGSTVRPTTDVEYNGLGEVVRRVLRGKNPDAQVESDDRITRYAYDANGLLTQTTDASGAVTQYDYDAHGDLVRRTAKGVVRSDSTAEAPKLRDIVKRYTLDAAGRIASETTSESDKLAQAETRKTRYNAFGEIAARGIGDGFEEFFEYSTLGKISKTNAGDGAIKFYVYDAAGNQTREIKGNGDATVDMKALSLVEASVSSKLYSRVSIYDQRNLVTQTIDPQIDVLKSLASMEQLYQQQWVPAWTSPSVKGTDSYFVGDGNPVPISGAQPRVVFSVQAPAAMYVSHRPSVIYKGVFDSEEKAKSTSLGVTMAWSYNSYASGFSDSYSWDVSALKGQGTKYVHYIVANGDSEYFAERYATINVSNEGLVSFNVLQPTDDTIMRHGGSVSVSADTAHPNDPSYLYYSYALKDRETGEVLLTSQNVYGMEQWGQGTVGVPLLKVADYKFVSLKPANQILYLADWCGPTQPG